MSDSSGTFFRRNKKKLFKYLYSTAENSLLYFLQLFGSFGAIFEKKVILDWELCHIHDQLSYKSALFPTFFNQIYQGFHNWKFGSHSLVTSEI
jgi:hypothetical protein